MRGAICLLFIIFVPCLSLADDLACRVENGRGALGVLSGDTGAFTNQNKARLTALIRKQRTRATRRVRVLQATIRSLQGKRGGLLKARRTSLKASLRSERRNIKRAVNQLRGVTACEKASLAKLPSGLTSIVVVPELTLQAGETISAPGPLVIQSAGNVMVSGAITARGKAGQGIKIESGGDVSVTGSLIAGDGPAGLAVDGGKSRFEGEAGTPGGAVHIQAKRISISSTARLAGGNGGAGRSLTATLIENESSPVMSSVSLFGGAGGKGGDVILDAGNGELNLTPGGSAPTIVVGNGGSGGNVRVSSVGKKTRVRNVDAQGGRGGDSGFPRFAAGSLTGVTATETVLTDNLFLGEDIVMRPGGKLLNLDEASARIFDGGLGGHGGSTTIGTVPSELTSKTLSRLMGLSVARASTESGLSCRAARGTKGRDCTPAKGARGGDGFFCPGNGGDVTCADDRRHATGTKDGGLATVEGGNGGNLRVLISISTTLVSDRAETGLGVNLSAAASIVGGGYCGRGGNGGLAIAYAGDGGPEGGSGGEASATGGTGGHAHFTPNGADVNVLVTVGGPGGSAFAFGGDGKNGTSCCNPAKPGQDGGTGGSAFALGGDSGDGTYTLKPGDASTRSGDAGNGGDGDEPGSAGQIGQSKAQAGVDGRGLLQVHPPPKEVEDEGAAATDGSACPVTGPVPTPTTPGTTPGQCQVGKYTGNAGCGFGNFEIFEKRSNGNIRTAALGSLQFLCESTNACPCTVSGVVVFGVEDHDCCVRCENGVVTVRCTNQQGGVCEETFQAN